MCAILVTGMDIWLTIESLEKGIEMERDFLCRRRAFCMLMLWLIAVVVRICQCIATEEKVLMDREGCTISLWWWKRRKYSWDYSV